MYFFYCLWVGRKNTLEYLNYYLVEKKYALISILRKTKTTHLRDDFSWEKGEGFVTSFSNSHALIEFQQVKEMDWGPGKP